MFYSISFAGNDKDGTPLRHCWLASHGRKLRKGEIASFSIPSAAKMISEPHVALSLRCDLPNDSACTAVLEFQTCASPALLSRFGACRTQAYLANGLILILKLKTGALLSDVSTARSKMDRCYTKPTSRPADEHPETTRGRKKSVSKHDKSSSR